MPQGTPLYAARSGTVKRIRNDGISGRMEVVIGDTLGHEHLYTHLSTRSVNLNQSVSIGQKVGNSGTMNSPHLHFEHRVPANTSSGWGFVNPEPVLTTSPGTTSTPTTPTTNAINLSMIHVDYRRIGDVNVSVYESEFRRLTSPLLSQATNLRNAASPMSALFLAQAFMENKYSTTGHIIKPADNNPVAMRPWQSDPRRTGAAKPVIDWSTRNQVETMVLPPGFAGAIRDSAGGYMARFVSVAEAALEWRYRLTNPAYKNGVYKNAMTLAQMLNIYAPAGDVHPVTGVANENSGYYTSVVTMLNRYAQLQGTTPVTPLPSGGTGTHRFIISMGHRNTNRGGATNEINWTPGASRALRDAIVARGGQAVILQEQDGLDSDPNWFPGGLQAGARKCVELAGKFGPFRAYLSMHYNGGASPGFHAIFPDGPAGSKDTKADNPASVGLARVIRDKVRATKTVAMIGWTKDSPGVMSEKETGVGAQGYRLGEFVGTFPLDAKGTARLILEAGSIDVAREATYINSPQWVRHVYCEAIVNGLEQVYGKFKSAPITGAAPKFIAGQSVTVTRDDALRSSPDGAFLTTLLKGTVGVIVSGPRYIDAAPWWEIRVSGRGTGHVHEASLSGAVGQGSSAPAPAPPPTQTAAPIPAAGVTPTAAAPDQGPQGVLSIPFDGPEIARRVDTDVSLSVVQPALLVPGPYLGSSASLVERASTNRIMNPVAGVDLNSITLQSPTLTRLTEQFIEHPDGFVLTTAVRATFTGTAEYLGGCQSTVTAFTAGTAYTAQMLFRARAGAVGKTVRLRIREHGGASATANVADATLVATGGWQRIIATGTLAQGDRTSIIVWPVLTSGAAGNEVDIAAVMLEQQQTFATSFIPRLQPASRNVVLNPHFEPTDRDHLPGWDVLRNGSLDAAPWALYHGGVASPGIGYHAQIDPDGGEGGGACLLLRDRNSEVGLLHREIRVNTYVTEAATRAGSGGQITVSFDMKATTGKNVTVGVVRWTTANAFTYADPGLVNITPTESGRWERVSVVFPVTATWDRAREAQLYLFGHRFTGGTVVEGDIWIDNVQAESGPATPFSESSVAALGEPMPGHLWDGTPHASTSQRKTGRRYLPEVDHRINRTKGSIMARFRTTRMLEGGTRFIFNVGTTSQRSLRVYWSNTSNQFEAQWWQANVSYMLSRPLPSPLPEWIDVYIDWEVGLTARFQVSGSAINTGTGTTWTAGTQWGSSLDIGASFSGANALGDAVAQVIVFDRRLTITERNVMFAEQSWSMNMLAIGGSVPVDEPLGEPLGAMDEAYTPGPPPILAIGPEPFIFEGRQYTVVVTVYRGTIHGDLIAPLDLSFDGNLVITHNDDAAIKRTIDLAASDTLDLHADRQIEAYSDTVIPFMTISDDTGRSRTEQQGVYILSPMTGQDTPTHTTTSIHGNDLTWLLARTPIIDGWTAPGNTEVGMLVHERLQALGFSPSQIAVGNTGVMTPASGIPFFPGTTWLRALNDLLRSAAWYTLSMNRRGVLTSRPYTGSLGNASPAVHYDTRRGHWLGSVVERDPDYGRFGNIAIARRLPTQRSEPYIGWTAVNNNPASHTSTVRRGPILIEPIIEGEFTTEAEARASAEAQLERGQSFFNRVSIITGAELDAESNQVIALDIERANKSIVTGRWWRQSWEMTYNGASAITKHSLNHVEVYR
jgi:hypothetical protein